MKSEPSWEDFIMVPKKIYLINNVITRKETKNVQSVYSKYKAEKMILRHKDKKLTKYYIGALFRKNSEETLCKKTRLC